MGILKKIFLSFKYRGIRFSIALIIDSLTRSILYRLLSKDAYIKMKSLIRLGYIANLNTPQTFNEKILFEKIFNAEDDRMIYADKFLVREFIQNELSENYLNKIFTICKSHQEIDNIDFSKLPQKFVVKANYGSGMNIIVKEKSDLNNLKPILKDWLTNDYNNKIAGTEYHYDKIKPIIIFEKYLQNTDGSIINDYKFFCFNGKIEFIQVVSNNIEIPIISVYDTNWKEMPFSLYNKPNLQSFQKPSNLNDLIKTAEILSKNFKFVRIDLYNINENQILFGEITYNPGGGFLRFMPKKFDKIYGRKL